MGRSRRRWKTICELTSRMPAAMTGQGRLSSTAYVPAGCPGMQRSESLPWVIPRSCGIQTAPTDGRKPICPCSCRRRNRGQSNSHLLWGWLRRVGHEADALSPWLHPELLKLGHVQAPSAEFPKETTRTRLCEVAGSITSHDYEAAVAHLALRGPDARSLFSDVDLEKRILDVKKHSSV